MNLTDPITYLPGIVFVVAAALVTELVQRAYRWLRPERVTCGICHGIEGIDVAIHTVDGLATFHEACVDEAVVTLKAPFAGTHRELQQDLYMQDVYSEDITR